MSTNSPAPGVPQTSTKAYVGGVITAATTIVQEITEGRAWWWALLDGIGAGLVTAGFVHGVSNRPKAPK